LTQTATERRAAEPLRTLSKGKESQCAELRGHGVNGVELQIYMNGEFVRTDRYVTRVLALPEADALRDALQMTSWARCGRCPGFFVAHERFPIGLITDIHNWSASSRTLPSLRSRLLRVLAKEFSDVSLITVYLKSDAAILAGDHVGQVPRCLIRRLPLEYVVKQPVRRLRISAL
jgi:hypothetical protein